MSSGSVSFVRPSTAPAGRANNVRRLFSRSGPARPHGLPLPPGLHDDAEEDVDGRDEEDQGGLPGYAERAPTPPPSFNSAPREYTLHMTHKKRVWASLKLVSHAPASRSAGDAPAFMEGNPIKGTMTLDLDSAEPITKVYIEISGRYLNDRYPYRQDFTFLSLTQNLWTTGDGDPNQSGDQRFRGKLKGYYRWPFSVELPTRMSVPHDLQSGAATDAIRLPPTFLEKDVPASIYYYFEAVIVRGGLFRHHHKISTMFFYHPRVQPPPASELRQLAYRTRSSILGPEEDPSGYLTRKVKTRGTLYGKRDVFTSISLSLALPLSYTRGTVIPCSLTISCPDAPALDALARPAHLFVHLQRRLSMRVAAPAGHRRIMATAPPMPADQTAPISRAVWWPAATATGGQRATFRGEIWLPRNLKPSFAIPYFSIDPIGGTGLLSAEAMQFQYSVVLLPLSASFYVPEEKGVLLEEPVEIATVPPVGPKARRYAPSATADRPPGGM
ncbi:hypothetical protein EV714DRAFT_206910 [Schizophyllum commune]